MHDALILLTFLPAALALNLTPGADMTFAMAQGLRGGPRAALAARAGISLGALIHSALAGVGLAAVIAAAPPFFTAIRRAGAAYLLYLAGKMLTSGREAELPAAHPSRAFADGRMINLANPKVILFILALVPQFVRPGAGPVVLQFLLFGGILATGGLVVNAAAGKMAARLGQRVLAGRLLRRISATIFAGLALRLAFGGFAHD